jgi:hypothetical protein
MKNQESFSYLKEFNTGIIGRGVWKHLLERIEIPEKDVIKFCKQIPPTEELELLKPSQSEIVAFVPETINGFNLSVGFWEKFGFQFEHNAHIAQFDWDAYQNQKLCSMGVYVGNPRGIGLGYELPEQVKLLPKNYCMTNPGVQISIDAIHFLMGRGFINTTHAVRCACDVLGVAAVGGGETSLKKMKVLKDTKGRNKKASLSCFKRYTV